MADGGSQRVRFTGKTDPPRIRIHDRVEKEHVDITTPLDPRPSPTRIDGDDFIMPVDTVCNTHTSAIEVDRSFDFWVRDENRELVAAADGPEELSMSGGPFYIEVASPAIKIYFKIEGGFDLSISSYRYSMSGGEHRRVRLDATDRDEIKIGARSFHSIPEATITTTGDPEDMADALSYLGSSLKSTSPERAFPTLRGYPPLIELGDEFYAPDTIAVPDTGITITAPPNLEHLYSIASLAHYLGATVEIGDPAIRIDGWEYPLQQEAELDTDSNNILQHLFLLDCVTRTEGLYTVDLKERQEVEQELETEVDFAALYDAPITERTKRYLELPQVPIAHAAPRWLMTADIVPKPRNVGAIPHVVDTLAKIRTPTTLQVSHGHSGLGTRSKTIYEREKVEVRSADTPLRGMATPSPEFDEETPLVFLDTTSSINHSYVGPGYPVGATKATKAGFERYINRDLSEEATTSVVLVNNDESMGDESGAANRYGIHDFAEFEVDVHTRTSVEKLAELLQSESDFFHYIGHSDSRGVQCRDGYLDVEDLDAVGVSSFLLNSCHSYHHGEKLVKRGAAGGFVTLEEVPNKLASKVGKDLARLIGTGHTLSGAKDILGHFNQLVQDRYTIIGNGLTGITQPESGTHSYDTIHRIGDGEFEVTRTEYSSYSFAMGSITVPYIDNNSTYYLPPGEFDTWTLSRDALEQYLRSGRWVVDLEGDLYWSDEVINLGLLEPTSE